MHVQVDINQQHGSDHIAQDVQSFQVVLQEPESGQDVVYETMVESFLTQDEFAFEQQSGNLRNRNSLKRIAKKFLEERVEIKRL